METDKLQSVTNRCKWRGQRYSDKKWIYGFLMEINNEDHILQEGEDYNCYPFNAWNLVYYSSVGQYTGFKDKNGTEIYEDDIVKDSSGEVISVVKWDGFNFLFEYKETWMSDFVDVDFDDLEVIGNIHDNPELLEKVERGDLIK